MAKWSKTSMDRLATCHPQLQILFNKVIDHYDCTVIEGFRTGDKQDELYRTGMSKLRYPESKHNHQPSLAVDVAPYFAESPHIRWDDRESFIHFAGFVKGVASQMGINIRCGIDWNSDNQFKERFFDGPHFELILKK
jgi:peptidoglycan L-alanyl-D-glutamate endopeptidase CwlK